MRFLNNPALSETDTNRDGVRQYLKARMPTFSFSDGEIRKLVRFFEALSFAGAAVHRGAAGAAERSRSAAMARALFTSEGAPCLKCHMTGDAKHDARATAPNFTVAKERLKPGWTKRWMLDPALMSPGTAMPSRPVPHGERTLGVRRARRRRVSTDIPRTTRICWCGTCSSSHRKNWGGCAAARARRIEDSRRVTGNEEDLDGSRAGRQRWHWPAAAAINRRRRPRPRRRAPAAGGGGSATPDEANGGTVTGKVAFAGEKPKMATLDMSANPVCERAHAGAPQRAKKWSSIEQRHFEECVRLGEVRAARR